MAAKTGPTFIRLMLGTELTRLREQAKLSGDEAAKVAGCSKAMISNVESGKSGFRNGKQLETLLERYGVDAEGQDELMGWHRRSKEGDWWTPRISVLPSGMNLYLACEGGALDVDAWCPMVVHGLCQTPDYARALMEAAKSADERTTEFIDGVVEVRRERKKRITEEGLEMALIMDESALRKGVGTPSIMRAQLRDLAELCELPNVTVRIIPDSAPAYRVLGGSFSILSFDPTTLPGPVVSNENIYHSMQFSSKAKLVKEFQRRYEQMSRGALPAHETPKFLEQLAREVWS